MLRFLFAMSVLLLGSLNAVAEESASASDKQDIIQELLAFPAPPPESIEPDRFTYDSPPSEDAPLEILGRYWGQTGRPSMASVTYGQSAGSNRTSITMKTRERLVEACREYPELAPSLLGLVPQTPDVKDILKHLYDENVDQMGETWGEYLKKYLKMNSKYFREELVSDVLAAKDKDEYGSVANKEEMKALAQLDWNTAEPILKKLEKDTTNPRTAALSANSILISRYSQHQHVDESE